MLQRQGSTLHIICLLFDLSCLLQRTWVAGRISEGWVFLKLLASHQRRSSPVVWETLILSEHLKLGSLVVSICQPKLWGKAKVFQIPNLSHHGQGQGSPHGQCSQHLHLSQNVFRCWGRQVGAVWGSQSGGAGWRIEGWLFKEPREAALPVNWKCVCGEEEQGKKWAVLRGSLLYSA